MWRPTMGLGGASFIRSFEICVDIAGFVLYHFCDESREPIELGGQAIRAGRPASNHDKRTGASRADGGCLLMSRTRLIFLGLLVVVAVGVVASASATEPPKACGGKVEKTPTYCVEGLQLENSKGEPASEKIEGTSGVAILKATAGSATTEVECKKGKVSGSIQGGISGAAGKSQIVNTFEQCKLIKPANCELVESQESEIKTQSLAGELTMTAGKIEDKLTPKAGVFASINIEGKEPSCMIAKVSEEKTFPITGTQLCEIDKGNAEAETSATAHAIICKVAGSGLKLGGNKAEMTSESTVKLMSGKKWNVKESV
jgi:hypothetical protein